MIVITPSNDVDFLGLGKSNIDVAHTLVSFSDLNKHDAILIFEGFEHMDTFIGWAKSVAFYTRARVVYVYTNQIETAMLLQNSMETVEIKFGIVDLSVIDYALYSDSVSRDKIVDYNEDLTIKNLIELTNISYVMDHVRDIQLLALNALKQKEEIKNLVETLELQNIDYSILTDNYEKLKQENNDIVDGYNILKVQLQKVLNAYAKCVYSEEQFSEFDLSEYDNPPTIIYLKTYEELIHFDSFCRVLVRTINLQLQKTVKVVRLVNSSFNVKIQAVSNRWYKAVDNFDLKEVQLKDLIVKGGNYSKLMHYLLANELELDFLVVVDDLNLTKDIIQGTYFNFNICRNMKHLRDYDLDPENTIVNNANSKYFPLTYNTVKPEELSNNHIEQLVLSNQPAIRNIIKTLSLGEGIV